jgi:hypothetical protein
MAYEIPGFKPGAFVAGADLSALQYRFVKLNSSGEVVAITADTDQPVGILQDAPAAAGRSAEIMVNGISKLYGAQAMTAGNKVGPSANGRGDDTSPTTPVGQVVVGTGAADELGSVMFNCANPPA